MLLFEIAYDLIRFIRFVSRFTGKLCNVFFISSRFKSPCKCRIFFGILNFATKQGANLWTYYYTQGRMHTPGHPGHGPGFGPIFFHFAVASTSGFGSIAEKGLGSIAEEE